MRAPVGENATKEGPVPPVATRRVRLPRPELITIALRERCPGPTTTRWPLGDTATPPTGCLTRIVLRSLNPTASMTATRRLRETVAYTRAPEVSTATEQGLVPTVIAFTVRMPARSTRASLRVPLTT